MAEGDTLIDSDLPDRIAKTFDANRGGPAQLSAAAGALTLADLKRAVILMRLQQNGGDRGRTCQQLGISRRSLSCGLRPLVATPSRQCDAMAS